MFVAIVAFYVLKVLLFLTFCFLAAGVYALFAWLLRHREPARQFKISGAALRSPIFVFYMLACASTFLVFGPEHLQRPFSHGEEPLPNGYVLTAPIEDALRRGNSRRGRARCSSSRTGGGLGSDPLAEHLRWRDPSELALLGR